MSTMRLTGTLARDARSFTLTDGTAVLEVLVHQPSMCCTALARRQVGNGFAAQFAARNSANHLKAGQRVTVHAAGFDIDRDQLVLVGVDHIEHHGAPSPAAAQPEKEA
jgi:hypothetical protein